MSYEADGTALIQNHILRKQIATHLGVRNRQIIIVLSCVIDILITIQDHTFLKPK